ncbi:MULTISPECIES: hypothetical protein [unclassified Methylobacterium]|uniref:hypothetical protein n=1 Tax=unclassified Methylobacterium TaxID=2615210 RepID=UPI001FBBDCA4|nr:MULTISPECIES: hypothetical protein [unclassified Methylobacterium]MCJ2017287.1 hypothetical protein [Methylobacterium sp. E-065]
MVRVEAGNRLGPAQVRPVRAAPGATEGVRSETTRPVGRSLVVIDGGRPEGRERAVPVERTALGQSRAGFITQLLTADDPTLHPSRLERTRMAAACYAEAARRLA